MRIVRGNPTPEELAALVVVLSLVRAGPVRNPTGSLVEPRGHGRLAQGRT